MRSELSKNEKIFLSITKNKVKKQFHHIQNYCDTEVHICMQDNKMHFSKKKMRLFSNQSDVIFNLLLGIFDVKH